MHCPVNFKIKTADEIVRDSNELGLHNFVESLRTLLIVIQNMNAQDVSADCYEETNLRVEDTILISSLCHSVWKSDDSILKDFKTIIEGVLTNVRFVFRVMTKYEQRGSVDATALSSFACPATKLTGSGRDRNRVMNGLGRGFIHCATCVPYDSDKYQRRRSCWMRQLVFSNLRITRSSCLFPWIYFTLTLFSRGGT